MDYTKEVWIDPVAVVQLFTKTALFRTGNNEELLELVKQRKYKITTEAWRAAMYLLALGEINKNVKYFLRPNPKDPPDFYGLDLFMVDDNLRGYVRDIEVFQYPNESELTLTEEISKKINKNYSKKTSLICQITRKNFKDTLGNINKELSTYPKKYEVWIIGSSGKNGIQIVAQVHPSLQLVYIDISEMMLRTPSPSFIQGYPGKSSGFIFENTGKKVTLTP